jgi:hypothetical protein
MTLSQHAEVFFDKKVKPFEAAEDWEGPDVAYRLSVSYDDGQKAMMERLEELLSQDGIDQLPALVIGAWAADDSSFSSQAIIKALVKNKSRLASLKALFLGDIIYEENEISWIEQSDVTPLLQAFPGLEALRVRGGNSLKFSKIRHEGLKQLIIETGGLRRSVIREICRCEFPNLEHLELWLGVENYGWDGGVEDLQPILADKLFPKLTYLGLRNSDIVDEIAPVVVNAPILNRLTTLDLSNGTLSDVGGQALLNLPAKTPLQLLNVSHHYMTKEMVKRLVKKLPCKVVAEDGQDPDEEWRSVVVSE